MSGRIGALLANNWLAVALSSFMINQAVVNLVRPMVSYRALALGLGPASLGLLSAAFSISPLLVAFQIGRLIDQRGERLFIVVGTVALATAAFGLALVTSPDWSFLLFVLFALLGFAEFTTGMATQALIARRSDERTFDRGFSAFSFFASIGQSAGPAIAGLVAGDGTPEATTRALALAGVLGLLILPTIPLVRAPAVRHLAAAGSPVARAAAEGGASGVSKERVSIPGLLSLPGVFPAILVSTTVLSSIDIVVTYLPALGEERGWAVSIVGGLLALRASSTMMVRLGLGRMADRFGRQPLLVASMLISAGSLIAIPLLDPIPLVAIVLVLGGAGLGIGQPLTMAWVAEAAPPAVRATVLAVRIMGNGVGRIGLPIVAGTVAAFAGAGGVLGVTGVVIALSLAAFAGGGRSVGGSARTAPPAAPRPPAAG